MDPRRSAGSFSCCLIGEGSLLAECGKLLLERGHRIRGVVSSAPAIRRWAAGHGLPATGSGDDLTAFLGASPFDYLFSVTNLRMLPPPVLALPRRLPINFHDALLPRGAGLFATTWAILAGDRRHGVTWHVMTASADAGSLLKQRAVTVDADETAHTLNLKCYEAGIESFAELVGELAEGRERPVTQDLGLRTYHGRSDRLPRGGIFSWREGAEELDAAVRACDFGPHPNGFGTVKLALGGDLVVVEEVELLSGASGVPPGTVIEISKSAVGVATASRDVRLTRLSSLAGAPLTPADLTARWGVELGDRFEDLDDALADRVTALSATICRHEAFWVRRLERRAPLGLPFAHPEAGSAPAGSYEVPVPAEVRKRLAPEAREGLLTVFLAFLARLFGEERFDVELAWPERSGVRDGLELLFASRVPFRAPVPSAARALEELREEVARELGRVARRRTYLLDLGARYRRLEAPGAAAIAVELVEELGGARIRGAQTRLLVEIPRGADRCVWHVAEDVLDRDVAETTRARFAAFLRAAAGPAGRDLTRIPLLSEAERHCLLYEWNDTAADFPRDRCVHQLFVEQARRRPEATAAVFEDRVLTYGELDRRSTRLAAFLGRRGIGPGALTGLYVERSAELVVGLLGILKAGAAYVPLDSLYPPRRIAYMLADTRLPLLLTEKKLERGLETRDAAVVALDGSWETAAPSDDEPYDRAAPGGLAYVIYTSGSTGRPKGVAVGHRGLTSFLCSVARTTGLGEHDRLLAVTTICFDIAGLELFLPLVTGGQVEVASARVAGDGFELRRKIEESRPSALQATPATWKMLIAAGWRGDSRLEVLCGGESLPRDLADGLTARARRVINLYGPTETTIWSSLARIERGRRITIGRPIANTRCYVLDRRFEPVPYGVPGELYIGGEGVAAGYVGRPGLTCRKFVPSPFAAGGVLYRTGDLVRHLRDGRLEYLDRRDGQVKLHGYRIELGDVEHALARHPAVREAVAVVREDAPGDRRLVAYVVPGEPQAPLPVAELRGHLRTDLPSYMVPAAFVAIERVPLTLNGKVDRKALPRPAARLEDPRAAPGTDLERTVAAIWRSVLGVERVGIDDRFLEIGGNSLLVTEVVRQLRAKVRPSLTSVDMFKHPTIRTLARNLAREPGAAGEPPSRRVERRDLAAIEDLRRRRVALRARRPRGR